MQFNQVIKLFIDDLKFFSDELFEQENISVFINIVEPVDVGSDCPSQLPSVCAL